MRFGGRGVPAGTLSLGTLSLGTLSLGTLSLGTRYTHSPVEVLDRADLDAAVRLLRAIVLALPEADLRYTMLDDEAT